MKIVSTNGQLTFEEMKGSLASLPKSNRWVRMGDTLPWDEYEKVYNKRLRNDTAGASNKPGRMVIAALIIKHKMNLSDEEAILAIQENPYMQYMCGLSEYTDLPLFDPSLFVTIRKRITIEDINALTLELARKSRERQNKEDDNGADGSSQTNKREKTGPGDLKVDATCADAEVRYPTDIDLVEDGSKYVDRLAWKVARTKKVAKPKMERERIRKEYLTVIKRKHKGSKLISGAMDRMLPLLHRDILTLINLIGVDDEAFNCLTKTEKRTLRAVIDMYHQQEEMHRLGTHTCDNRIISIHQPHVRPIVRGKAKAKVEFGAKIGVSVVNGYSFIDHHSWDAYNESEDLNLHLGLYQQRFGTKPERFFGDKIYLNRNNRATLKETGIEIMGPPLGRPPKNPAAEQVERERIGTSLRNQAEAQFGTAKRVYRANNIRAKLPETAQCWTAMCYFVKNLTKFIEELCRALIKICRLIQHFCHNTVRVSNFCGWPTPTPSWVTVGGSGQYKYFQ